MLTTTDFGGEVSFDEAAQRAPEPYRIVAPQSAIRTATYKDAEACKETQEGLETLPPGGLGQVLVEAHGCFVAIVTSDEKAEDKRKSRRRE